MTGLLNTTMLLSALGAFVIAAYAAEPMDEEDLSRVSAFSTENILNIFGPTASGVAEVTVNTDQSENNDVSNLQTREKLNRLESRSTETDARTDRPSDNPDVLIDGTIVRTTGSGGMNDSAFAIYDTNEKTSESAKVENGFEMTNKSRVQQVRIINARDDTGAIRGSYNVQDIRVQSNVIIQSR